MFSGAIRALTTGHYSWIPSQYTVWFPSSIYCHSQHSKCREIFEISSAILQKCRLFGEDVFWMLNGSRKFDEHMYNLVVSTVFANSLPPLGRVQVIGGNIDIYIYPH